MSELREKLEAPARTTDSRARASLPELRAMWSRFEVLAYDASGPTWVCLHVPQKDGSWRAQSWRRVEGSGRDALFEVEEN
jgi:hypothetical protein